MGMIPFVGSDPAPNLDTPGFTRLARQPEGQGGQYQPLEFQQEAPAILPLDEASAPESEAEEADLSEQDVTEQLHAFTHMQPVFVRPDEGGRLPPLRQTPDISSQAPDAGGVQDDAPAVSPALRALVRHERLETDRCLPMDLVSGRREMSASLTGEFARQLVQPAAQAESSLLHGRSMAGLPPLPGADGSSERESLVSDLRGMSALAPSPLTRTAEYQWAPARLSDNQTQWGQQLVDVLKDKLELQVNQGIKQAHIRLDPPELGRLELTVRVEGDRLSVQLNVTNPAVREAMIQSMERLRMSLAPHHAGGVEVNVGQGGEQERGDRWQQEKILAGRRQWQEEQDASGGAGQDWLNALV
ncbi:flagellar hook-length control protein FliK [Aeromonas sp. 3925]|uniref:flagellar hook-length control protein FliK n=1 Tax=Aeromonas genomosp. paramedia TaxID=3086176 RepID=UPI001FFD2C6C|nr:flagellar hook-length control protein FliK [Aeromonas genomosp. paramedia]MCK2082425.1 flagellar hook-length control protein FliK [Aeromonas genomosp. paramedia]